MDMPLSSRAAVLKRLAAVISWSDDRPAVKGWSDLSLTEQLIVEGADAELASVLRNQMSAVSLPSKLKLSIGQPTKVAKQLRYNNLCTAIF